MPLTDTPKGYILHIQDTQWGYPDLRIHGALACGRGREMSMAVERKSEAESIAAAENGIDGSEKKCCADGGAVQSAQEESCCGRGRHKKRTAQEQKALLTRLKRVEGQIRGIEKMVENDAYCPDILIQVSAATSALNSFNKVLLGCHIRGCVVHDIQEGKDETIDELCEVLQKLMK